MNTKMNLEEKYNNGLLTEIYMKQILSNSS